MANRLVGYARVSTSDQETSLQLDAFGAAGVDTVYQEKASSIGKRPQLHRALASLKAGDTLVVWKVDRLARSLSDLLHLLTLIEARGACFRSLTEPIDTSSAMGTFVLQILGAVAQLERALIIQRTTAGIHAARARGVQWGRRYRLPLEQRIEVAELVCAGVPLIDVADAYSVSRGCVHNYLLRYGDR
ncbi:recombinase family protein [Hydrogenophaga sp. ANAO-22]|uniref:recombinase family protein n=1 Tax=Hydrogenophaga sp. ANAO-22 TaxID=3166645 RepID=UPI0036D21D29